MGKYDGKKLLMLGSNVGATDIVRYARANGAEVIVADYYLPERSEAKRYADRDYLVSTADLDALEKIAREEQVNGILSGISEFNTLNAMELSQRLGLRFYCNKAQWDRVESKDQFRKLCIENDVPVPHTWFTGEDISEEDISGFRYPLVLKPVDACTSAGVFICHNAEELKAHIAESKAKSKQGRIIIEEFVSGNEFTAHYVISGGKAALVCVDNRYPIALHDGDVTTIPVARIYPSLFQADYIRDVNESVIRMCEAIGVHEGILFVQGIHDPERNVFRIFEAGLRCAGEAPFRFLEEITHQNFMQVLVDSVLLGASDYDLTKELPDLGGACCGVVSFAARHGVVSEINGLQETVERLPSVRICENRYPVGREVPDTDTLRQLMLRFVMVCGSREQMAEDIRQLNAGIRVLDAQGSDMIVKFDPQRLFDPQ